MMQEGMLDWAKDSEDVFIWGSQDAKARMGADPWRSGERVQFARARKRQKSLSALLRILI